jgi:hypothetical protein
MSFSAQRHQRAGPRHQQNVPVLRGDGHEEDVQVLAAAG